MKEVRHQEHTSFKPTKLKEKGAKLTYGIWMYVYMVKPQKESTEVNTIKIRAMVTFVEGARGLVLGRGMRGASGVLATFHI